MGEPQIITFGYKELTTALIKHQGIHEGFWSFTIQVGVQAGNMQTGPSESNTVLGIIIPLLKLGLQKHDKPNPLTVDAAEVNPPPKP
ncbi:MAG: hypothetical protein PHU44_09415 [Syntrophales bacterium]|nr:hypothetical protein [Syntrophales bacterium]MDD5640621.1 hypothetical protein [Syntrophales bacterium]